MNTKRIGEIGEEKAAEYLKKMKYKILDRNYRCRFGEVDIIARSNDYIVFIEVKTRSRVDYGRPIEAINSTKLNRILKTVNFYLAEKRMFDWDIRIDAIEVFLSSTKDIKVNHIENIVCD